MAVNQQRVNEILDSLMAGRDVPAPSVAPVAAEQDTGPGFFRNLGLTVASTPFTAGGRARLEAIGAGILQGGVLDPARSLLQLPGMFTDRRLATDRAADFIQRFSSGMMNEAEEAAMAAGVDPETIAFAHATGEFIGFLAPVTASIKGASIILRAPINTRKILTTGNIVNEAVAGAMFGGLLTPSEDVGERVTHALEQSALFGVGRIVIGGTVLPFKAYQNRRAFASIKDGQVREMVERIARGEHPDIDASFAIPLARLLSETEMVASSSAAQEIVKNLGDERAIYQAVRDTFAAGTSAGLIRDAGTDFASVAAIVEKFKLETPNVKFSIIKPKGAENYTVYFGTKGLSGRQASQVKQFGMFEGQLIEKNGATFEVLKPEPLKDGRFWVKGSDGKQRRIKPDGVSVLPHYREDLDSSLMMDDLYKAFEDTVLSKWSEVTALSSGAVPEGTMIQRIREGRVPLDDNARRAFDVSGAIAYPEELGINTPKVRADMEMERVIRSLRESGQPIPDPDVLRMQYEAILHSNMQTWLGMPQGGPLPQIRQVLDSMAQIGTRGNNLLLSGGSVMTFEDMFEAWARQADIPAGAPDFAAVKANFGQRLREKMWGFVPDEDMSLLRQVQDTFFDMVERGELPLEALAEKKMMTITRLGGGRIEMRDARTGATLTFGSEQVVKDFLLNVVRSEKAILGDPFNMGSAGLAQMNRGFSSTDGIFHIDGTIPTRAFVEDIPFTSGIQNVRDMLVRMEAALGVPLFTGVFDVVDRSLTNFNRTLEPWAKNIGKIWEGLPVAERREVGLMWSKVEGENLSVAQAVKRFKDEGFSTKQITAFIEGNKVYDALFKLTGIEKERYINLYYSRILPDAQKYGGKVSLERVFGKDKVPPLFQFFGEMQRTGELAVQELDPAIVMHKYARALFFKREVAPVYEKARGLLVNETSPRFSHLSIAQQEAIEKLSGRKFRPNDYLLANPIRHMLSEYLNLVRGMPTSHQASFINFATKFFDALGVKVAPGTIEEMSNIGMSALYGAAMAFRPALVARNMVQSTWTMYSRVGGKYMGRAYEKALTLEGAVESFEAGANRATEAGIPFGSAIRQNLMDQVPVTGTGTMSRALAATIRLGIRAGEGVKDIARTGLLPYSAADDMERAAVYWWQKMHTDELLTKFEGGSLVWDKFLEDGLPHFEPVIKQEFTKIYNRLGREQALRWIGKQAADEADFIYGAAAQPAWMQSTPGRFLGMFGTWPIWAIELYGRRAQTGTPKQVAAFWARSLALTGIFTNMTLQSGINLWSWIAPASVSGYAGGPFLDYIDETRRVIIAPLDEKAGALKRLATSVGRLSLPGQVAFTDFRDALDMENPGQAALRVMLGRPTDNQNWALEMIYNPNLPDRLPSPELRQLQVPTIPLEDFR
jgi:hypothetical protein